MHRTSNSFVLISFGLVHVPMNSPWRDTAHMTACSSGAHPSTLSKLYGCPANLTDRRLDLIGLPRSKQHLQYSAVHAGVQERRQGSTAVQEGSRTGSSGAWSPARAASSRWRTAAAGSPVIEVTLSARTR